VSEREGGGREIDRSEVMERKKMRNRDIRGRSNREGGDEGKERYRNRNERNNRERER
jgi:hypothetical protein